MKKRHVYPILRYDEYLAGHDVDLSMLISVPKVLEDADAAELEAQRLNDLRSDKGSRYWAVLSRIALAPAESTAQGPDDFSSRAAHLAAAIRLGYEVERDDPNIGFESPPDNEIEWLAAWLVSEGWAQER
ncbi:MAG: hypothetical protein CMH83_22460 [Nocardioides sp.]|nr:hypothetical protein [Nocardioides sp.]